MNTVIDIVRIHRGRVALDKQMTDLLTMRRMYLEGASLDSIAEAVELSKPRVSRILRGESYGYAHFCLDLQPLKMRAKGRPKKVTSYKAREASHTTSR